MIINEPIDALRFRFGFNYIVFLIKTIFQEMFLWKLQLRDYLQLKEEEANLWIGFFKLT